MARLFEVKGGVNAERIGQRVTIPNHPVAKCMYYLKCVCTAIEYDDDDMEEYINYQNYRWLTPNQRQRLFLLCRALSPDEFDDKVFFESEALSGSGSNEFYRLTQVRHQFMAVQSIVIGGQRRDVKKIMTYTQTWMRNFYYEPMQLLEEDFRQQRQRQAAEQILSEACLIS